MPAKRDDRTAPLNTDERRSALLNGVEQRSTAFNIPNKYKYKFKYKFKYKYNPLYPPLRARAGKRL